MTQEINNKPANKFQDFLTLNKDSGKIQKTE